jgi:protein-tyrosine phosphatase
MVEIIGQTGRRARADGRHIALPGTFNLRDLGGYPTSDGGAVRWRALLRSDALHRVQDGDLAILRALNLRTVIDLRSHAEAEIAPVSLDALGARTLHRPVLSGGLPGLPAELSGIYRHIIDDCGAAIAAAIEPLGAPGALPALIHCSAGKDRTGIVVALLLAAIGVPDDVIAADYALSGTYLDPGTTAAIGQVAVSTGLGDRLTPALLASPPELMAQVLARARSGWGSAAGYLLQHGLDGAGLTALRAVLVEYPEQA